MQTKTALPSTALVSFDPAEIPIPSKLIALLGCGSEIHPLILQSLFVRAARGERLGAIIADNRFNAYGLARLARAGGFNPSTLLSQVQFSRSFTCHQLHHAVVDLVGERIGAWSALYVLGLLEAFWDEDIRYPIAARLLSEILLRLRQIVSRNRSVLVTVSPPPKETTRQEFITRVLDAADVYWQPSPAVVEQFAAPMSMW